MIKQTPISFTHKCDRTVCNTEVIAKAQLQIDGWSILRIVESGHITSEMYLCSSCAKIFAARLQAFDTSDRES